MYNIAHATLIIADSNDLTLGGQATQAGGTGFTGTWTATGTIDVIGGDLSAPISTGYALTQSGTAQSIRGDYSAARQNHRALATALTGDTIWFSLLLQNQTDTSRGGISFNGDTFLPSEPRILSTGKTLFVNGGTASGDVFVAGQTALVLGRITVADVGNDTFEVWVNPDVSGGEAGLGAATGSNTGAYFGAGGINRIGNVSYGNNSNEGAIVDMIYLSDGPNAFADVTGVTAPITLALAFTRIHLDPVSDRLALQWTSRDQVLYDLLYSNDPTATFDPSAWSILTNGVSGTESSTEIVLPDFQGQSWSTVAPWWVFRLREQ